MYSIDSRIGYSDIDGNGRMKMLSIVNLLQDCCTLQSEDVGNGVEVLAEMNRAWILISWQIVIKKYPKVGDKVKITTYPYEFKTFFGSRCFDITDESGESCIIANSIWVYIEADTGKPARIEKEVQERYSLDEKIPYEWLDRKIKVSGEFENAEPFRVRNFCIDSNKHMNNAWYIALAAGYLPNDFAYENVHAEYLKSAMLDDLIYPKLQISENRHTVVLADEAGETFATVDFYGAK